MNQEKRQQVGPLVFNNSGQTSSSSIGPLVFNPIETRRKISSQLLTSRLKNSKSLVELRNQANENNSILEAVHDSVICVACGRFGSTD
jgi:hypothetical protein